MLSATTPSMTRSYSVIQGLEEWCHILEGTKHKIEILNDHQNLTYFHTAQNLNCCQASWSLYLSCFDFELIYCPGHHSAKPDALSRCVDHKWGEDVGCIYAPDKVNPNIFQFYSNFSDIFHHTSMHPLFRNFYEFYLIFIDFISPFIVYQISST